MPQVSESRYLVRAGWDSAPHLDEKAKAELLESIPPHMREARTKGIPSLGSGAIYPVAMEDIEVQPFEIPKHWPRAYALDVGWNTTACIWGAKDPQDGTLYLYTEHYKGKVQPFEHAIAIKARGEWINGTIDPAARGRAQEDGKRLIDSYIELGLRLTPAKNAVEAGIYEVWRLLTIGQLRIFSTLQNLKAEMQLYRRDENGKIVKTFDHACDAMRYLVMTWDLIAGVELPDHGMVGNPHQIADQLAGY